MKILNICTNTSGSNEMKLHRQGTEGQGGLLEVTQLGVKQEPGLKSGSLSSSLSSTMSPCKVKTKEKGGGRK